MAVKTFQVTLSGGVDAVVPAGNIWAIWYTFINNASHEIDLGDATLQPIHLAPGGTNYQNRPSPTVSSLAGWCAKGTGGDKLDVIYDDGISS